MPGGSIIYTIVLSNAGPGNQADNPGDEFVDTLPGQVHLVMASASSGTATGAGGVVAWNGSIAAGASVTLTIDATVDENASGQIDNLGTYNYDADGDGTNESSGLTDDPNMPGSNDPTGFVIARDIPAFGPIGALLLVLGLVVISYRRRRASLK